MKYIKEFNSFNEGMLNNFGKFILAAMIGYGSMKVYIDTTFLKEIYHEVNDPMNIPNEKESNQIEDISKCIIETIQTSDKFDRFGKDFIIDSLETIEFRLSDESLIDSSIGVFINISGYERYFTSKFLNTPKNENFILIMRNQLYDKNIEELILHEMYHYFDYLLKDYSKTIKLDTLYDKRFITDEKYSYDKIRKLLNLPSDEDEEIDKIVKKYGKFVFKNKNYLMSSSEVFARWNSMKYKMIKFNIINSFNEDVTLDDINELLSNRNIQPSDNSEYIDFLLFISLNDENIKKLNEIL
jgi:hypothetical protein